jgi:hypothetical protein
MHCARRRLGSRRSKRASLKRAAFKSPLLDRLHSKCHKAGAASRRREARKEAPIGYGEFPVPRIISPVNSQNFPVIRLREFAAGIWFRGQILRLFCSEGANRKNSRFYGNLSVPVGSSSVAGGGDLLMALIAPRRSIDRLG